MNPVESFQRDVIFVAANSLTIIACIWIAVLILRLLYEREDLLGHGSWSVWPVIGCLFTISAVHACHVLVLYFQPFWIPIMVVDAVNAVAFVVLAITARVMFYQLRDLPSVKRLQSTNDALAQTLGSLSEKEST